MKEKRFSSLRNSFLAMQVVEEKRSLPDRQLLYALTNSKTRMECRSALAGFAKESERFGLLVARLLAKVSFVERRVRETQHCMTCVVLILKGSLAFSFGDVVMCRHCAIVALITASFGANGRMKGRSTLRNAKRLSTERDCAFCALLREICR